MKQTYGFIFADEMEFKPFAEVAQAQGGTLSQVADMELITWEIPEANIIAIHGGVGKVYAAIAAMVLVRDYKVDYLLSAGFSGAISGLRREDIIAGTEYVECDFDMTACGYEPGQKVDGCKIHTASPELLAAALKIEGMKEGRLGTGDLFLTDSVLKNKFKDTFAIKAFDMESGAIATVCEKFGVPFLSIRRISDDAEDGAVEVYREMNNLADTALTELVLQTVKNMAE